MKTTTFSQFWKQKSSSQHKLLSTFDTEKGKMKIAFPEVEVPFPKTVNDYKKSVSSFNID